VACITPVSLRAVRGRGLRAAQRPGGRRQAPERPVVRVAAARRLSVPSSGCAAPARRTDRTRTPRARSGAVAAGRFRPEAGPGDRPGVRGEAEGGPDGRSGQVRAEECLYPLGACPGGGTAHTGLPGGTRPSVGVRPGRVAATGSARTGRCGASGGRCSRSGHGGSGAQRLMVRRRLGECSAYGVPSGRKRAGGRVPREAVIGSHWCGAPRTLRAFVRASARAASPPVHGGGGGPAGEAARLGPGGGTRAVQMWFPLSNEVRP
jgi:hypothetical protein